MIKIQTTDTGITSANEKAVELGECAE